MNNKLLNRQGMMINSALVCESQSLADLLHHMGMFVLKSEIRPWQYLIMTWAPLQRKE